MQSGFDGVTLGGFLRARREATRPEDVGLGRRARSRTPGLRREDVAQLCSMSVDYLARLERGSGSQPSTQMVSAIAQGLRLNIEERDYLFALCGHRHETKHLRDEHVNPGLMRVLDRLHDTPAQVMGTAGETLLQTPSAIALLGDETHYTGLDRSAPYRWFTAPAARERYDPADHAAHSAMNVAILRRVAVGEGPDGIGSRTIAALRKSSTEFSSLWGQHAVSQPWSTTKRFIHPEVGRLELFCQILLDPDQTQSLLTFTASPGSESVEKLSLLTVLGAETFTRL